MRHIFLILILTLTISGYAFGECSDTDKKGLEAFDRAWGAASEKGERAALAAIYADDYMGLPAMQNKSAAIDAAMAAAAKNKANPGMADKVSHDNYMITCTPNSAVITHRNVVATKNGTGGKEETFWTRSVHFLEKRGGKWQVVGNAGNGLDEFAILGYMEQDWSNADVKRDASWFEKNFASDYTGISSLTGKVSSKADDVADVKTGKSVTDSADISNMGIRIEGNAAVVTGIYHVKGKDENGKAFDRKLSFTDTFIKRDGRWQVWASQGTPIQ